jgi:hypothetical protein
VEGTGNREKILIFLLQVHRQVNLGDAVAEELEIPFEQISLEMIYRGMYHFSVAHKKGLASEYSLTILDFRLGKRRQE